MNHALVTHPATSATARFRVACWPTGRGNPYQQLFYEAMAVHGIDLVGELTITDSWLKRHSDELDALHFHWPEALWRDVDRRGASEMRRLIGVWRFLNLARRLRKKIIWTVHNLEHHEGAKWTDFCGYRVLGMSADLLIFHSNCAADVFRARGRFRGKAIVMPHGTYAGVYPTPRSRNQVLRDLGLCNDLPMVCCVGQFRRYKGLEVAVDAARELCGTVQLVIAGQPHPEFDIVKFRSSVNSLPRAVLLERFVDDQEFVDILAASDAVLLPYHKITGSGALLAAWTHGRGVVASELDYFREMAAPEPDAVAFFSTGSGQSLANAIRTYLEKPAALRHSAAQRLAARYAWHRCVEVVAAELQQWMHDSRTA